MLAAELTVIAQRVDAAFEKMRFVALTVIVVSVVIAFAALLLSMKNPPSTPADATSPQLPKAPLGETDARLQRDGNNFNFLRVLFAATVIFSHSFELIDGNQSREPLHMLFGHIKASAFGLYGFFLISGFLIVRSWQQNPKWWPYFKKRILRIYPGFIVSFLISVLVVGALGTTQSDYFSALNYPTFFRKMLTLQPPQFESLRVFEGSPYPVVNGSMWTISLEFICYVLVAVLGAVGLARKPWLWLGLTLILCLFSPVGVQLTNVNAFHGAGVISLFVGDKGAFYVLATFFFVGSCFFLFLDRIRFTSKMALLIAAAMISAFFTNDLWAQLACGILGGYILFWFAFLQIPLLDRFKYQSDVSYGLYLYGWPVQKLLIWYFPAITPYVLFLVALIISYVLGYVSWQWIEKPALQLKRRINRDPRLLNA